MIKITNVTNEVLDVSDLLGSYKLLSNGEQLQLDISKKDLEKHLFYEAGYLELKELEPKPNKPKKPKAEK